MIDRNSFVRSCALAMIACCLLPAAAMAELYISPVIRSTVTMEANPSRPDSVRGSSTRHGSFELGYRPGGSADTAASDSSAGAGQRFGHNVPLFVALEHLVPEEGDWLVRIDSTVGEDRPVSWSGGISWEGALKQIQDSNGLSLAINHSEQVVGVSLQPDAAAALAYRHPRLWRMFANDTLESTLERWAETAGYRLVWDQALRDVSYPIVSTSSMTGELFGAGGVLDRVMNLTAAREYPMAAEAFHGDKVIHIKPAKYKSSLNP